MNNISQPVNARAGQYRVYKHKKENGLLSKWLGFPISLKFRTGETLELRAYRIKSNAITIPEVNRLRPLGVPSLLFYSEPGQKLNNSPFEYWTYRDSLLG